MHRVDFDTRGSHVLFKILPPFGAGNRHDGFALVQQPGQRNLPGLRMLGCGDIAYDLCRLDIGVEIRALIARSVVAKIVSRLVFRALDAAGQEAAPERRKGHEADVQLAQKRNHIGFQVTLP